ncbi:MAG TPA: hypothetical protein VK691_01035 [Solirubrobacteraceae bacterium]|jgi:hypothetical protein|nr:hypothetical protein [Solirubrobacteraceae bacterium]
MEGRITIELRTEHTPNTGSGLPDLGHDAYWLMKMIRNLVYTDAGGTETKMEEKYSIIRASTDIR